jgi:hypothetical protein
VQSECHGPEKGTALCFLNTFATASPLDSAERGAALARRRHPRESRRHCFAPLQLTQDDERGWRATFYTTSMEHSPTSATGAAWERTPWHATQRAAWEALR